MLKVKVLFDFCGDSNEKELTISEGETITVIDATAYDDGWWEGTNSKGETGFFPKAYVEHEHTETAVLSDTEVKIVYQDVAADDDFSDDDDNDDNISNSVSDLQCFNQGTIPRGTTGLLASKYGDNSWSKSASQPNLSSLPIKKQSSHPDDATSSDDTKSFNSSVFGDARQFQQRPKKITSYFLTKTNIPIEEQERVSIVFNENCFTWNSNSRPYTVIVSSAEKQKKFKGLKCYITYRLTPSFNNTTVSRRYKHFSWLRARLVEKFVLITIPPLPSKQNAGRFEDEFIEQRRLEIQLFVDWLCRHPVLSTCKVWQHFLTCTNDKIWKAGKRAAENDILCGLVHCAAIVTPETKLSSTEVHDQVQIFQNFLSIMRDAVKTLTIISEEQKKNDGIQMKKNYHCIGTGFIELAKALTVVDNKALSNKNLSSLVGTIAGNYFRIGKLLSEQHKCDWKPLIDCLNIYRGILSEYPVVLSHYRYGVERRAQFKKMYSEHKLQKDQCQTAISRVDVVNYAVMAEMSHFRSEREKHLQEAIMIFLDAKIKFYEDIALQLRRTKQQFTATE